MRRVTRLLPLALLAAAVGCDVTASEWRECTRLCGDTPKNVFAEDLVGSAVCNCTNGGSYEMHSIQRTTEPEAER